ncbi:CpsD/CapB family tyrosine-protein kinase [Thiohalobacter sp. IOR34]|uniref:CpsD/CapB family tyrosine-protein kinase n=1 Tax=Thiohalobacter sp. IOR34 TaxID=3057176 RepID=UPI0025B1267B|nr:CpsD/CapB family tyrosine-protein kinase [Thiohalobacter sp. IOR34]WJW75214.1 CpsD/CapB family tyrosine-protein kinase [Thiohalobacter sp. IOR34]
MERIKVALEKARKERGEAGTGSTAPQGQAARPAGTADISYTQTRVTPVSPEIMKKNRILTAVEDSPFADAYKMLSTQVLQRMKENGWNVLAVTSPGEDEGKTLTAINLAISLAREVSHTVLLVDANLRHPSIHEQLGLQAGAGLSDYLIDDAELPELLLHPEGLDNLVLLPAGRPVHNSAELLNSPKMVKLVDELKHRYPERFVIFDLPPVLSTADALAFSPYVDAALLVLEEGKTQAEQAQRAVDLLESTNVLGTVLNKSGSVAA